MIGMFLLGFVVLVAASYVGTTMALRGFFGREYHDRPGGRTSDDSTGAANSPRTDDVPRAREVEPDE